MVRPTRDAEHTLGLPVDRNSLAIVHNERDPTVDLSRIEDIMRIELPYTAKVKGVGFSFVKAL